MNTNTMRGKIKLVFLRIFFVASFIIPFVSCVSIVDVSQAIPALSEGDFATARQQLDESKHDLYAEQDKVLYYLDAGSLSHYSSDWDQSNKDFSEAEKLIEEYFAESVTQAIGSFIVNDTLVDYAGDEYEDIYTNLFMALNYIHLGKIEDAFVEVRRFDNKQKVISLRYEDAISSAKNEVSQNGGSYGNPPSLEFHNSAFARYLSLLMYRSSGDIDNARIDKKYMDEAFLTQKNLYPWPMPSSISDELKPIEKGMGRLNFISTAGLAPKKLQEEIRYYAEGLDTYIKFALPIMEKQFSSVSYISADVYDGDGNLIKSSPLEPLESIENIAIDTFEQKKALIYLKSISRALVKATAASVTANVLDQVDDGGGLGLLFRIFSSVAIEVSEQADVRTSKFFPSEVWVGGMTLPIGKYTVSVHYFDSNYSEIENRVYTDVDVKPYAPNIVESVCIR